MLKGLSLLLVLTLAPPALADGDVASFAKEAGQVHAAGALVSTQLTQVTGVSLSPLVGMSVLGAWSWYRAPEAQRARLPWYQRPLFWGVGLALLALAFAGDKVPGLRTALKSVKLYENKVFGLLAYAVMVDQLVKTVRAPLVAAAMLDLLVPAAHASGGGAAAPAHSIALVVAVALLGLVAMSAVWLLGHAIDVLVLLSPLAPLDFLLRALRNAVLVLLVAFSALSPALGALLAVSVIVLALAVSGWTFRLTVFGTVISGDLLFFHRVTPEPGAPLVAFATSLPGVPRRSYGRLAFEGGTATFSWRPWLVMPRHILPIPRPGAVGQGLVSPVLLADAAGSLELVRLPPRYRGAEGAVAQAAGGLPVIDVPLVRGLKAAWAWLSGDSAAA